MRWSGISPTVDLYNVVVYGAAPYSTPPLLEVDHIGMGMRIVSLLRGTWYLNDVRIDHPVVRVLVDARGRDNLPQTKRSSQSHTSVFDLAVRHVRLDRGEVYYSEFLVGKMLDQLRKHRAARVHPALLPLPPPPTNHRFRPERIQIVPGDQTTYPAAGQPLTPTSCNFPRTAVVLTN